MTEREIELLTHEYGGDWAINHARRLIHLVLHLGEGMDFSQEVIRIAAYIHDWGAYPHWRDESSGHLVRSTEVVMTFLAENRFPAPLAEKIIECVRYHHGGPPDRSIESILFTDADAIDLLGVAGTLKVFSMKSRDLAGAVRAARNWRDTSMSAITTEKARIIAEERRSETDELLKMFEEETFGYY